MSSILDKIRANTAKSIHSLDKYFAGNMNDTVLNAQGNGVLLAIAGLVVAGGAIMTSPVLATAGALAAATFGASMVAGGASALLFGKAWEKVRGEELLHQQNVKDTLSERVPVINNQGQRVNITQKELYKELINGTFSTSYQAVVNTDLERLGKKGEVIKPQNLDDYLDYKCGGLPTSDVKKEKRAILSVMSRELTNNVADKMKSLRERFTAGYNEQKNYKI